MEVAVSPNSNLSHLTRQSRHASLSDFHWLGRHHNEHTTHSIKTEQAVEEIDLEERAATSGRERRALMKGLLGWETLLEDLSDSFFTPAQSQLTGHERLAWDNYYRYSSISSFARKLAQQHRTVECLQLGHTAEGRPLLALIIATDAIRMARAYTREVLSARRHQVKARTMQKNLQEYMTSDELSVETLIKRSEKGRKEKGHWVQGNIKEETDMAHSDVAQRQMTSLKFSRKKSKMRKPERLRQRQTLKVEEGSKRKLRKKVVEQKKADKWSLRKKRVMSKTQNGETRAKGRSGGKLRDKAKDISRSKLRKEAGRSKPVILIEADGGRWRQDGGRWRQDGGRWRQDGGRWRQDGGRWRQDGGRWRQDGGRWRQ
ncbi:hypothetical protein OTU49_016159, partial [Cherax quadricarinatus]